MGLWKMENFLSSHLEGFFNNRFGSNLELVELIARIEKEVSQKAKKAKGKKKETGLPKAYVFYLSTDDYHRLCAHTVIDSLYEAVEKMIIYLDLELPGSLSIRMVQDSSLKKGLFELRSFYSGTDEEKADTLVIERTRIFHEMPDTGESEVDRMLASLSVLEGVDDGMRLAIGERRVDIGRQERNDFILTDTNVSRLHAWIGYESHRHVLHDAGSTNGTFVNGKMIRTLRLRQGDKIQMGETVFQYEVI